MKNGLSKTAIAVCNLAIIAGLATGCSATHYSKQSPQAQQVATKTNHKDYSMNELLVPVTQTGSISLKTDNPSPIISLMGLIVQYEKELKLTPEQTQTFADFRKEAKPKRLALEKNAVALRANLRQALINKAPKSQRENILYQLMQTEKTIISIRSQCTDVIAQSLSPSQYDALMQLYKQSVQK